ncbi:MAG: maleylacetoacetate isomerase [Oxalobacteraceae bacterium]|jgi:maleylacetoacetate isomerase|nr:maleylacetoacetate isomerase [Oxalobacteraceae bacterium]
MKLYSYFRSSASYRVRIALNLKGLPYETVPVHLVDGAQFLDEYRKLNVDALVPSLTLDDSQTTLTQSLAIIEYLEEVHPTPALLPSNALDRAWIRSLVLSIACDIHPLNNLRVLRYLVGDMKLSEDDKNRWYRHWVEQGLASIEQTLATDARCGKFCFGDTPTLADCFLVPQIANAQRMNCDISGLTTLIKINKHCLELDAFTAASPSQQPDAE